MVIRNILIPVMFLVAGCVVVSTVEPTHTPMPDRGPIVGEIAATLAEKGIDTEWTRDEKDGAWVRQNVTAEPGIGIATVKLKPVQDETDDSQPLRELWLVAIFEMEPEGEPDSIKFYQADVVSSILNQSEYLEYLNWAEEVMGGSSFGQNLEDEEIIGRFFLKQFVSFEPDQGTFTVGLYIENILTR
jgi:hypothetical protein